MRSLTAAMPVTALLLIAPISSPGASTSPQTCSASNVLNAVGDALTTGDDRSVLTAALNGKRALLACGDAHDAIGAGLIAADALGDVNLARKRCAELQEAAHRAELINERARTVQIISATHNCR